MSDDFFDDFGWEDMALAGALAEEMAEEEKQRRRLKREMKGECDSCCDDYEIVVPPDEDPYP